MVVWTKVLMVGQQNRGEASNRCRRGGRGRVSLALHLWDVAQWIEHRPTKSGVAGSTPVIPTYNIKKGSVGRGPSSGTVLRH